MNDAEPDGPERGRTTLHLVEEEERRPTVETADRPNHLVVSLDESVVEAAMRHRRAQKTAPERFHVVGQSEMTRSSAASADASASASPTAGADTGASESTAPSLPFDTGTVDGPADFTTLVEHVDEVLSSWSGPDTAVVLDGVAAAIEATSEPRVFRLLHILIQVVAVRGAALTVILDTSAEDVDAAVFRPLFDAVEDHRE